jgi:hypothetical protein
MYRMAVVSLSGAAALELFEMLRETFEPSKMESAQ